MNDYGVAWIAADDRELGSTGGFGSVDVLAREAEFGLTNIYPSASHAVIYKGRSFQEGEVIREIRRQ